MAKCVVILREGKMICSKDLKKINLKNLIKTYKTHILKIFIENYPIFSLSPSRATA